MDDIIRFGSEYAPDDTPRYFFLDEIQVVAEWEKWLRVQLDRPSNNHFVITGSNSSLLGGDLGTVLTGRYLPVELFPFSFLEYRSIKPEATLETFLHEGGFPRPLQIEDPPRLLRQYFVDIIERDVRRHVAARSSSILTQVAKAVCESTGCELSARKLTRIVDVSVDTLINYLDAFTKAYLILPCPYFSFSERKRLVRNTKWYPIDNGLCASVITHTGPNIRKSFETAVFHALRRADREVYYWRDEGEVDFVILEGTRPRPVQVSWDGVKARHLKALDEFVSKHGNSLEPIVVTRDNFLGVF